MNIPATDAETAAHLRAWIAKGQHDPFWWPTDGCSYEQHIRFVEHRNENWHGEQRDFAAFVLAYAEGLERAALLGEPPVTPPTHDKDRAP